MPEKNKTLLSSSYFMRKIGIFTNRNANFPSTFQVFLGTLSYLVAHSGRIMAQAVDVDFISDPGLINTYKYTRNKSSSLSSYSHMGDAPGNCNAIVLNHNDPSIIYNDVIANETVEVSDGNSGSKIILCEKFEGWLNRTINNSTISQFESCMRYNLKIDCTPPSINHEYDYDWLVISGIMLLTFAAMFAFFRWISAGVISCPNISFRKNETINEVDERESILNTVPTLTYNTI